MTDAKSNNGASGLADQRRHKVMFDNTWTLVTILAATLTVLGWHFGLAQVDIGPIIWTLAGLALMQLAINSQTQRATSGAQLQLLVVSSQMLGTALMGVGWHLFGGLQQPLFPLLMVVPLVPAALLLDFWPRQVITLGFLLVLFS